MAAPLVHTAHDWKDCDACRLLAERVVGDIPLDRLVDDDDPQPTLDGGDAA